MIDYINLEQYRENNRIEAKRALGGFPNSLWETYSSFANTMGGVILLGVDEHKDTSLHAVDLPNRDEYVKMFWEVVSDKQKISAKIVTEKDVQKVEYEGKRILVITVPRAERCDRPVYIGTDPFTGTYRRGGEGDYRCNKRQVALMLKDAKRATADMRPLSHIRMSALDFDCIKAYRSVLDGQSNPELTNLSDLGFLKRVGGASKCKDGNLHPTMAGLLCFGKREKIAQIIKGFSLCYNDISDGQNSISPDDMCAQNLYSFFTAVKGALPIEHGNFVHSALCEALANCLVNADYSQGGIVIEKSDDKLTFTNPGSFGTSPDRATKGGVSAPRNAGIKKIFSRLGVGEGLGNGIPYIFEIWRKKGWTAPHFKEKFDPDSITLELKFIKEDGANTSAPTPVSLRRTLVVRYLTTERLATLEQIADALNLNNEQTRQTLQSLLSKKLITTQGEYYKLSR